MASTYDNAARAERARETRLRIVLTARDILLAGGYPTVTITSLARTAEVSPQTVYNSIGGKAAVVKAVYDHLLAGGDEPVPVGARPQFVAMSQACNRSSMLTAYAALRRRIHEGVGPLLAQLLHIGAAADPLPSDLVDTIETERRTGVTRMATAMAERHGLPDGISLDEAIDILLTLTAPEVGDRLIRRCRWTAEQFERWLARMMVASLG
ncbi:TetR/AcrR family transcriptional regulator [Aestuariimicrobium ganziense]|uniref:TetR/AcrR family transcriptional regulator n=1 Tax=Aestuariimicrobium ganziense TaxID=2773677 RepID=UPI001943854B|nr:TetR/AcrR family transcriptional regulator [Aestuariimicrobium ganziense]